MAPGCSVFNVACFGGLLITGSFCLGPYALIEEQICFVSCFRKYPRLSCLKAFTFETRFGIDMNDNYIFPSRVVD